MQWWTPVPRAQRCDRSDKRHLAGDADEPLAQRLWRVHQHCLERDHGLCSRFERSVAGYLEVTDHFNGAITNFGLTVGVTRKHGPCSGLGIHGIGLAISTPELPVDPADLNDAQTLRSQRTCEAGTV
jgi:hypothetical protein